MSQELKPTVPKFRAWHKQFKLMKRVRKIDLDYGRVFVAIDSSKRQKTEANRTHWNFNNIELMQWTGFKNFENQDLYFGDIVGMGPNVYQIENDERGCPCLLTKRGYPLLYFLSVSYVHNLKILGNIFENPELLEEQDIAKSN